MVWSWWQCGCGYFSPVHLRSCVFSRLNALNGFGACIMLWVPAACIVYVNVRLVIQLKWLHETSYVNHCIEYNLRLTLTTLFKRCMLRLKHGKQSMLWATLTHTHIHTYTHVQYIPLPSVMFCHIPNAHKKKNKQNRDETYGEWISMKMLWI